MSNPNDVGEGTSVLSDSKDEPLPSEILNPAAASSSPSPSSAGPSTSKYVEYDMKKEPFVERVLKSNLGVKIPYTLPYRSPNDKFKLLEVQLRYLVPEEANKTEKFGNQTYKPERRSRSVGDADEENFISLFGSDAITISSLRTVASGTPLMLNVTWLSNDAEGWTSSGLFFWTDEGDRNAFASEMEKRWNSSELWEPYDQLSKTLETADGNPTTSGDTTGKPSNAAETSAPSQISGGGDNGSDGGLSNAAKAGIGAGAGVGGLILITAFIWFLCFRRRHKADRGRSGGPYDGRPDTHASEYMVKKEATSAQVAETPHSPYSDDGSLGHDPQYNQQQPQSAHVQPLQPAAASPPNRANDDDLPPTPPAGPASHPRSTSRPKSTSHPGSSSHPRSASHQARDTPNVAHLIEEGMTEEEIRRLEEEEAALDDAIARAQQGRRGA